jgi:hypothetical protein
MARGGSGSTLDPFSFPGCVSWLIDGCRAFAYQSNEFFSNLIDKSAFPLDTDRCVGYGFFGFGWRDEKGN